MIHTKQSKVIKSESKVLTKHSQMNAAELCFIRKSEDRDVIGAVIQQKHLMVWSQASCNKDKK